MDYTTQPNAGLTDCYGPKRFVQVSANHYTLDTF